MAEPTADTETRGARRRRETQGKLLDAAFRLVARQGVEQTTIQQITDAADVGFGSFYNHFESKEAIVEAVLETQVNEYARALASLTDVLDDPAAVLSASCRHVIRRVLQDPEWGFLVVRVGSRPEFQKLVMAQYMARDVARGLETGRFAEGDPEAVVIAVGGVMLACIGAAAHGQLGDDAPERTATQVLQLVGLPPEEARTISQAPLPDLAFPDGS